MPNRPITAPRPIISHIHSVTPLLKCPKTIRIKIESNLETIYIQIPCHPSTDPHCLVSHKSPDLIWYSQQCRPQFPHTGMLIRIATNAKQVKVTVT